VAERRRRSRGALPLTAYAFLVQIRDFISLRGPDIILFALWLAAATLVLL
jgi:hypothetical protein